MHARTHKHTHQLNLGSPRSGLPGVTPDNWPCSDTGIQIAGVTPRSKDWNDN